MKLQPLDLARKLDRGEPLWSPRVIAEMNDHQFKLARIEGNLVLQDQWI